MKILITGLTGYLGGSVARRLSGRPDVQIFAIKRSFSDIRRVADLMEHIHCFDVDTVPLDIVFEQEKIDMVLHCATNYGRNHESRSNIVDVNLMLPLKLLELSVKHKVKAFINTDTMLDKGISDYTLSKKQFNDWLGVYGAEILAVNVALEHFFGPGDDSSKFVSYMVRELLRGADRIPLTLGEQRRDFIYIDDVVSAFEYIIQYVDAMAAGSRGYKAFEVGRGDSIAVKQFLLMMQDIAGNMTTKMDFGALPYRAHEIMCVTADTGRIKALGWAPKVDLAEGLRRTIEQERKRVI